MENNNVNKKEVSDYIVCYLDILGYKELIHKYYNDIEKIEAFQKSLRGVQLIKNIQTKEFQQDTNLDKLFANLINKINYKMISDSIIISMPFETSDSITALNISNQLYQKIIIEKFLNTVSMIYFTLIFHFGHLLRGAITIGKHYEYFETGDKIIWGNEKDFSLFIFSKAFIQVYEITEKHAEYPRIIIDDELIKRIDINNSSDQFRKMVYFDSTGIRCLNIYSQVLLDAVPVKDLKEQFFYKIKNNIEQQINNNRTKPEILKKYKYFIEYHNRMIKNIPEFNDCLLDISQ